MGNISPLEYVAFASPVFGTRLIGGEEFYYGTSNQTHAVFRRGQPTFGSFFVRISHVKEHFPPREQEDGRWLEMAEAWFAPDARGGVRWIR